MESLQLRNIQNIENSLSLLKLKIQSMSKLNSHKEQALDKLVLSTIPLVQKKMKQSRVKEQMQLKKNQYLACTTSLKRKNEESRLINQKEINRSKQLVSLMKHHNSLHLKESKRQNEHKIRQCKETNLIKKRQNREEIKKRQQQSQLKIQQFHIQKQHDLKLRRMQEAKENQHKIEQLMSQLKDLAQQESLMQLKVQSSENNIHKFKKVIKKVESMKTEEFNAFRQEMKVLPEQKQKSNSKHITEAILLYASNK